MTEFVISNVKIKGLSPLDFYNNKNYNASGFSSSNFTIASDYVELVKNAIGGITAERLEDSPLNRIQIEQIKTAFSEKMNELIPKREAHPKNVPAHKIIDWKGTAYEIFYSLTKPINRQIIKVANIIEICDECLAENKPMYISINQNFSMD